VHTALIVVLSVIALYCAGMIVYWDLKKRLIPDVFLFPLLLIGLLLCDRFFWIPGGVGHAIAAGVLGYAAGFLLNIFFKAVRRSDAGHDPIGMGDIKLLAAGGIWLGATGLSTALIIACLAGALWAWVRKQRFVPFAPFFFAGAAVAVAVALIN
jgi:leader peptidase (prepilin peptidase)/N-methyltransferase